MFLFSFSLLYYIKNNFSIPKYTIAVKIHIPLCISLPVTQDFIPRAHFRVSARSCKSTDIPDQPQAKAQRTKAHLSGRKVHTYFTPPEISVKASIAAQSSVSAPTAERNKRISASRGEKNITKAQTVAMGKTESLTASVRSASRAFSFGSLTVTFERGISLAAMTDAGICKRYMMTAYFTFPSIAPTAPTAKAGPVLLQKPSARSASSFEQNPFSYTCATAAPPAGKPEIRPMIYALISDGETRKTREKILPARFDGEISEIKIRLMTKKGKSVGMSV